MLFFRLTLASSFLLTEFGVSCIGLLDPNTGLADNGLLDILCGGFIQFTLGQIKLTWVKGIGAKQKIVRLLQ
jgi:hypothetical protein